MSSDWYTLLSLSMRYWFAALIVVIVLQAWRGAVHDSRNARKLRTEAPITGAIGEFIVLGGGGKYLHKGLRVPVPREGLAGSSRRADVRLQHSDVNRYHARLELRENGLLTETIGSAEITLGESSGKRLLLRNGDVFSIGQLKLMLVMYDDAGLPMLDPADEELFSAPAPVFKASGKAASDKKTSKRKGSKKKYENLSCDDFIEDLFDTDAFKPGNAAGDAKSAKTKKGTTKRHGKVHLPFED